MTRWVFLDVCGVVKINFLWQFDFRSDDLLRCAVGIVMLLCDKEDRCAANNCALLIMMPA